MSRVRPLFCVATGLLPLLGCAGTEAATRTATPTPEAESFRIASWNLEGIDARRLADSERASTLAGVVRQFELVAVHRLHDESSLRAELLRIVDVGAAYEYAVALAPAAHGAGAETVHEQAGVYYRADLFDLVGSELLPDAMQDSFAQPPWIMRFRHHPSGTTFALIDLHVVEPSATTVAAADAVADVVAWVVSERDESNVFVTGELQRGSSCLASEATTGCAHEGVVVSSRSASMHVAETGSGADTFGADPRDVSDHRPVWIRVQPR